MSQRWPQRIGGLKPFPRWLNQLILWFQQGDPKGQYAFYRFLCRYFKDRYVHYNFDGKPFFIPVDEWCFWLEGGPQNYYLDEFDPFCNLLNRLGAFTFFDLGADIGTVSGLVARRCSQLERVLAFEPNPGAFSLLDYNLTHLGVEATASHQAVSDFNGRVRFATDNTLSGDHNGHILPNTEGDTEVTTLDKWLQTNAVSVSETVVLKIDVEGQEVQTVAGATELLKSAKAVVILLEIHPDVLANNKQTAEDLLSAIENYVDVQWFVPKFDQQTVDRSQPFFNQFPVQQYDVIAISTHLSSLVHVTEQYQSH